MSYHFKILKNTNKIDEISVACNQNIPQTFEKHNKKNGEISVPCYQKTLHLLVVLKQTGGG